jgi:hypothetical protein
MLLGSFILLGVNSKLEHQKSSLGKARLSLDTLSPALEDDIHALERVRIHNDAILH